MTHNSPQTSCKQCLNGTTPSSAGDGPCDPDSDALPYGPWAFVSKGPQGPFSPAPGFQNCANGEAFFSGDGSVVFACPTGSAVTDSFFSVASAPSAAGALAGNWSHLPQTLSVAGSNTSVPYLGFHWEDQTIWRDPRGHYHALMHAFRGQNTTLPEPGCFATAAGSWEPPNCSSLGGHAFSLDASHWWISREPAYTALVEFQDGTSHQMRATYVDSLLVHWPWPSASKGNVTNNATQSSDPLCNTTATTTYDEKGCRLSTWRAMLQIYESGKARSIGVSNYNITHFEEIRLAGLPLPALTQSPFHLYLSSSQMDILSYCWRHGIVFLGYSPFGVPDYKVYNASLLPSSNELTDPVVTAIASSHAVTPAQVLLAWQWQLGIPTNPRSMNRSHMEENLAAYSALTLNQTEMHLLNTRPQDMCSFDSSWYECAGSSGPY